MILRRNKMFEVLHFNEDGTYSLIHVIESDEYDLNRIRRIAKQWAKEEWPGFEFSKVAKNISIVKMDEFKYIL
jgi:tRNA(Ile)-lysidine synthase TilS/MesJ